MTDHIHDDHCNCPSPSAIFERCTRDIERVGWSGIGVGADPAFVYTVGRTVTWDSPEIVVVGLPVQVGHQLLGIACEELQGVELVDGLILDNVLENYPVRFVLVDRDRSTIDFNVANGLFGDKTVPFMQMIWPDVDGFFPDEIGVDSDIADFQNVY